MTTTIVLVGFGFFALGFIWGLAMFAPITKTTTTTIHRKRTYRIVDDE